MPFIAAKEAVVLHEQDVALAREYAGGNADGFFFPGNLDQPDVGILSACCSRSPSVSGNAESDLMPASLMPWATFEFS